MDDQQIKERTQKTAEKLFSGGAKLDRPYTLWREFDPKLANDFSRFITGNLYSREVLTIQERQMAACAMLAIFRSDSPERAASGSAVRIE